MSSPTIIWVFVVNSGIGLQDREEHVYAPVDADQRQLEAELYAAGYIRVEFARREWDSRTSFGGYPLYYLCADGFVFCPKCANENLHLTTDADSDWCIVATDINYEDTTLRCDHCYESIESAYGEEESCES